MHRAAGASSGGRWYPRARTVIAAGLCALRPRSDRDRARALSKALAKESSPRCAPPTRATSPKWRRPVVAPLETSVTERITTGIDRPPPSGASPATAGAAIGQRKVQHDEREGGFLEQVLGRLQTWRGHNVSTSCERRIDRLAQVDVIFHAGCAGCWRVDQARQAGPRRPALGSRQCLKPSEALPPGHSAPRAATRNRIPSPLPRRACGTLSCPAWPRPGWRVMLRPRPVPSKRRDVEASACANFSKTRFRNASESPAPRSSTSTRTIVPSDRARTRTSPPSGEASRRSREVAMTCISRSDRPARLPLRELLRAGSAPCAAHMALVDFQCLLQQRRERNGLDVQLRAGPDSISRHPGCH